MLRFYWSLCVWGFFLFRHLDFLDSLMVVWQTLCVTAPSQGTEGHTTSDYMTTSSDIEFFPDLTR